MAERASTGVAASAVATSAVGGAGLACSAAALAVGARTRKAVSVVCVELRVGTCAEEEVADVDLTTDVSVVFPFCACSAVAASAAALGFFLGSAAKSELPPEDEWPRLGSLISNSNANERRGRVGWCVHWRVCVRVCGVRLPPLVGGRWADWSASSQTDKSTTSDPHHQQQTTTSSSDDQHATTSRQTDRDDDRMMLRELTPAPQDENAPQPHAAKQLLPSAPAGAGVPTKSGKQSKWTANAARIVLAPVDINASDASMTHAECTPAPAAVVPAPIASPLMRPLPSPIGSPALVAPTIAPLRSYAHTHLSSRLSTSELMSRESVTKDAMTIAGQACMAAWTAALEASRAYRVQRKAWRRAKLKLAKRQAKEQPAVPLVELAQGEMEGDEQEEQLETSLTSEPIAIEAVTDLGAEIEVDDVEQMEEAIADVERSEVQYAALERHEETEEEGALEGEEETSPAEAHEETSDAIATTTTAAGTPPSFEVMSFHFGGKSGALSRQARGSSSKLPVMLASKARPTASDKAHALALKQKLEADMLAHESRRLALHEQQKLKQAEFERRRHAAKEKVDEQLARRTHGKVDEAEWKRVEAEARRAKVHDEEKKERRREKERKRRELEKEIDDMKKTQQGKKIDKAVKAAAAAAATAATKEHKTEGTATTTTAPASSSTSEEANSQ